MWQSQLLYMGSYPAMLITITAYGHEDCGIDNVYVNSNN